MTVPSQLARALGHVVISNGKTRLFVAGFLIIFLGPLPFPDAPRNHVYNGFFFYNFCSIRVVITINSNNKIKNTRGYT